MFPKVFLLSLIVLLVPPDYSSPFDNNHKKSWISVLVSGFEEDNDEEKDKKIVPTFYITDQWKINQKDGNGEKDGLWIDAIGNYVYTTTYKHGCLNGPEINFKLPGCAEVLANTYHNGKEDGLSIFSNKEGWLNGYYYLMPNHNYYYTITLDNGEKRRYKPKIKGYYVDLYPHGGIHFEGWDLACIYDDDTYVANALCYGNYTYYKEDGSIDCISHHQGGSLDRLDTNSYRSGSKDGLWITGAIGNQLFETFKNGKRNGLCCLTRNNHIAWISYFEGDNPSGLFCIIIDDKVSSIIQCGERSGDQQFFLNGYEVNYYPNGQVSAEGWIRWRRGSDLTQEAEAFGDWILYDEDGSSTKKYYLPTS